ncbi:MAG: hypothetical protein JWM44_2398 [Bacilli bacterium]|nr:hypothetical protein [Bacilli bacterium]
MSIYWFLFVTFLIIFIQGYIYKLRGLKKIHYNRSFSVSTCFMGDEVYVQETISNRKLLPLPWLYLESQIHTNLQFQQQANLNISKGDIYQNHKSIFSLMPFTQITRKHRVVCLKRGCYRLNTVSMTCGDAFGLSRITKTIPLHAELIVYPQLVPMAEIPFPSRSWQGDVIVRRWIMDDPFIIAGAREYQYGDSLNGINWKATARSGGLQVHNRDRTADHKILILLNFDLSAAKQISLLEPEMIEKGISYAATIAEWVISRGMEAGFACNGAIIDKPKQPVRIAPRGGKEALTQLYNAMGKLVIEDGIGFEQFLTDEIAQETQHADIVLISAYVSEEMERQIERFKAYGSTVTVIQLTADSKTQEGLLDDK